jgi:predicted N-acetyltransferase YhbS
MKDFQIRDARSDERDATRELTLHAYAEYSRTMHPDAWAGLEKAIRSAFASDGPAEHIVADDEGTLIGCVMLFPARVRAYGDALEPLDWPEVRLLAVRPEARGRGVARALMDECLARARKAGASSIGIHTSRSMGVARRMYERMGFVRVPAHDHEVPGGELVEGYRLLL